MRAHNAFLSSRRFNECRSTKFKFEMIFKACAVSRRRGRGCRCLRRRRCCFCCGCCRRRRCSLSIIPFQCLRTYNIMLRPLVNDWIFWPLLYFCWVFAYLLVSTGVAVIAAVFLWIEVVYDVWCITLTHTNTNKHFYIVTLCVLFVVFFFEALGGELTLCFAEVISVCHQTNVSMNLVFDGAVECNVHVCFALDFTCVPNVWFQLFTCNHIVTTFMNLRFSAKFWRFQCGTYQFTVKCTHVNQLKRDSFLVAWCVRWWLVFCVRAYEYINLLEFRMKLEQVSLPTSLQPKCTEMCMAINRMDRSKGLQLVPFSWCSFSVRLHINLNVSIQKKRVAVTKSVHMFIHADSLNYKSYWRVCVYLIRNRLSSVKIVMFRSVLTRAKCIHNKIADTHTHDTQCMHNSSLHYADQYALSGKIITSFNYK